LRNGKEKTAAAAAAAVHTTAEVTTRLFIVQKMQKKNRVRSWAHTHRRW